MDKTLISKPLPPDLSPEIIYRNDPFLLFFRGQLKLPNIWIFIIEIVLTSCCFYGLYTFSGDYGILSNAIFAILEIFTAALLYIVYLWLPDAVVFLFNTLKDNGVVDLTHLDQTGSMSYLDFLKKLGIWLNSVWWIVGTFIFVVLYLLNRFQIKGPPFLTSVPFWLQIITAFVDGFIAYNAIISVIRLVITLIFVNRMFLKFTINIFPLHPDGAGGFGSMKQVVGLSAVILLATTLTYIETILISNNYHIAYSAIDTAVLIIGYIILTLTIIIGWLVRPHKIMVEKRNDFLEPLSIEFRQISDKTLSLLPAKDDKDYAIVATNTDSLSAIKKQYDLLHDTYPTWPIEVNQLRTLIASALSLPALISLFPYIADLFNIISNYLAHHLFG